MGKMKKNNNKIRKNKKFFKEILFLEIFLFAFLCLFTAYKYENPDKVNVSLSDWQSRNIAYDNDMWQVDENIVNSAVDIIYGPYIELPADVYIVKVQYACDIEQMCLPSANNENVQYLIRDFMTLNPNKNQEEFKFELTQLIDNFELVFKYNGQGYFAIKGIDIYHNPVISIGTCIWVFLLLVLFDLGYLLYIKLAANKTFWESPDIKALRQKAFMLWQDEYSARERLLPTALCALAFGFTFIIFGPCDIYIQNIQEIKIPFISFFITILTFGFITTIFFTGIFLLLHGKIYDYAITLFFSIIFAGYIQGFININHGVLDGSQVDWPNYKLQMLTNSLFWCTVIILSFLIRYFNKAFWQKISSMICMIIIMTQAITLIVMCISTSFILPENKYISRDGIYEISDKQNVVFFLLDRCDSYFVDDLIEKYPDWNNKLSGFTKYQDFVGSYSRTFPSVIYILTGYKDDNIEPYISPLQEYIKTAWQSSSFLTDISEANNGIHIYSDEYALGPVNNIVDKIDNIKAGKKEVNYFALIQKMSTLSAYRYLPEMIKPYFVMYSGDLSSIVSVNKNDMYNADDVMFWQDYCEYGLKIDKQSNGIFVLYHLRGAHPPYVMNEKAESISDSWDDKYRSAQIAGNMNMIFRYIEDLKQNGLYDNTTIIISTDHAVDYPDGYLSELDTYRIPLLLIKPAGADISVPLKFSNKQIDQDNLRASIISYFGLDTDGYERTIEDIGENEQMTRYFWMQAYDEETLSKRDNSTITYEITGNGNDFNNWKIIEKKLLEYSY